MTIPERLDEITPDWLTEALRSQGHIADAPGEAGSTTRVSSIERQPLGDGEGFMGVICRLSLSYDGDPGDAPKTLIAKLPTPIGQNRVMGEVLGAYWREIHFYQELSGDVPVRVPRVYYADLTPDANREKFDQIVRVLDRLPSFIVGGMMAASGWIVSRNVQRYVLLIEDLAPARVLDQVAGGSLEECAHALEAAALLHACFWESPQLEGKFWLARQASGPRTRQRMYRRARTAFCERYASLLSPADLEIFAWADRHGEAVGTALHGEPPSTLIHCDFRLDNVFFDDARPEEPIILADWQLAGIGAAGYDVAYLLSGALSADATPDEESALLAGYHEALCEAGVAGHPMEALRRDYQRGLLSVLQLLATTDTVDMGEARGATLMEHWIERTLARLRPVPLESLLPTQRAARRR